MESLEKNFVDISKLFKWGKEVEIVDSAGETLFKVYMRVIGDADLNKAKVYALRKSAELRGKLRDPNSDERYAYIPSLDDVNKEALISVIIGTNINELARKAIKELNINTPKEPGSDATLEEQEKYQEEIDNWPTERQKAIEDKLTKETDKIKENYELYSLEELKSEYEKILINSLCEAEMYAKFEVACVTYSVYNDPDYKKKTFKSIDEIDNLPPNIKEQFLLEYRSLDIKVEDLKKLQEATQ